MIALLLIVLAVFIWQRDLQWTKTAEDTLPILAAFPLFFWLGKPFHWNHVQATLQAKEIWLTTLLFFLGVLFNATFLLAMGWTYLLWIYLKPKIPEELLPSRKKLFVLPLLAFPWIALDADSIGWWFRLSSAFTCSNIFSFFGFAVKQEGTNLLIHNIPISIEAACAGLNTLQSTLIAGTCANYLLLSHSTLFWWNLPLLVLIAWLANTIRIMVLVTIALFISPQSAVGAFHTIGGILIVSIAFLLAYLLFHYQTKITAA